MLVLIEISKTVKQKMTIMRKLSFELTFFLNAPHFYTATFIFFVFEFMNVIHNYTLLSNLMMQKAKLEIKLKNQQL